jgi:hypothetical protein
MKVVYIAGKFRGPNAWEIHRNVHRAEQAALWVAQAGAMPLCPHANTAHFHGTCTDDFWIDGTLELLRRCDALFNFDPARALESAGTRGEIAEAKRLGLPVFERHADLAEWLNLGAKGAA